MKNIVCFGEILWDVFPNHEKIGGAPLNVAYRLTSLENEVSLISAVGKDHYGRELLSYLNKHHINTEGIQLLNDFETGKVMVDLDSTGSATYTIKAPSAWDHISLENVAKSKVQKADAFIFGSLAAREKVTRSTLFELLEVAKYNILDLNLRPPHYNLKVLNRLINQADFIKFNDDELYEICQALGSNYKSLEHNLTYIAGKTNTRHLCVTRGKDGALVLYDEKFYENSGYPTTVVDTVGAGDSFLATLMSELLTHNQPQKAVDYACAVGALVAGKEGANPELKTHQIEEFINAHS